MSDEKPTALDLTRREVLKMAGGAAVVAPLAAALGPAAAPAVGRWCKSTPASFANAAIPMWGSPPGPGVE